MGFCRHYEGNRGQAGTIRANTDAWQPKLNTAQNNPTDLIYKILYALATVLDKWVMANDEVDQLQFGAHQFKSALRLQPPIEYNQRLLPFAFTALVPLMRLTERV